MARTPQRRTATRHLLSAARVLLHRALDIGCGRRRAVAGPRAGVRVSGHRSISPPSLPPLASGQPIEPSGSSCRRRPLGPARPATDCWSHARSHVLLRSTPRSITLPYSRPGAACVRACRNDEAPPSLTSCKALPQPAAAAPRNSRSVASRDRAKCKVSSRGGRAHADLSRCFAMIAGGEDRTATRSSISPRWAAAREADRMAPEKRAVSRPFREAAAAPSRKHRFAARRRLDRQRAQVLARRASGAWCP